MGVDLAVVGGGLAGATLALQARRLGASVRVFDAPTPGSASQVAAGLMTPVTGFRMAVSWRYAELYPEALAFYRSVEAKSGTTFFDANTTARILASAEEAANLDRRRGQFVEHVRDLSAPLNPEWVSAPHGAAELSPAGRLDVPAYLRAARQLLGESWVEAEVDPPAWESLGARFVAFCQGYRANPLFPWLAFRATKGEVLTVELPGFAESRTLNRAGTWLYPLSGGTFLAGSTYDHADLSATPTDAGRAQILARLGSYLLLAPRVTSHRAGVRPILDASRPAVGVHPQLPRVALVNGLGSKGALTAPAAGRMLARHLLLGETIDAEFELGRLAGR